MISKIETQLGQFTKIVNERLLLKNPNPIPQPHVMVLYTKEDTISEPLVILNEATKYPDP